LPELVLTHEAREALSALPFGLREAVAETITEIGIDPKVAGRPLLGRLRGLWSARVGSYRVLYTVEESVSATRVIVRAIRHLATAYPSR
jgi:mRNA-degrading endonuclease RelE of RelBE toxin-antitoxin system